LTDDLEDWHEILLSEVKHVVVEEVEVEIDDKEGAYVLAKIFALYDLGHQVIWYF